MARMSLDTAIRLSAEVKGGGNIDRVKRSLQELAQSSQVSARDMATLRSAAFQFARANDNTVAGIRNSIAAFRGLQEQAQIGSREFRRYSTEIQQLEQRLRGLEGPARQAGESLGQQLAAGLAAAGGAVAGALASFNIAGQLTQNTLALEAQSRRLRVMSDDANNLQAGVIALVREQGYLASTTEASAAAYDILQAGFVRTSDILDIVRASTLGAVGGFTDLVTVSDALTSILNGYNRSAGDAAKIVDQIKAVTDDGKISMEAYAESIGRVVPSAAAAKLPLEQINAAIAALTAQGVPVETTFSGINQAIKTILKPTQEAKDLAKALGLEFNAQALATKGLGGFLADVAQKTGKSTDALSILFSDIDGYKAVVGLLNDDLRRFNQFTENQASALGKAADAAAKGVDPLQRLNNAWKDLTATIGNAGLPLVTSAVENLTAALKTGVQYVEDYKSGWDLLGTAANNAISPFAGILSIIGQIDSKIRSITQSGGLQLLAQFLVPGGTALSPLLNAPAQVGAARRQGQQSGGYVSRFAGARDAAFARAQQITGAAGDSTAARAAAAARASAAAAGTATGGGSGGKKNDFQPSSRARALMAAADKLGISPLDLATIISFETGGTFSPSKMGGAGGNYMGLIQFGPNERKAYGARPNQSFEEQVTGPVVRFFQDRFGKVGMSTQGASLLDLYTTVLAGNPRANRNARDSFGTSPISGVQRMGPHRQKALSTFFGGSMANVEVDPLKRAESANQAYEQINQQRQAAEDLLKTEQNRLRVLEASDPLQRQVTEAIIKQSDIQDEYTRKLAESRSPEERRALELARENALRVSSIELERSLTEASKAAADPLNEAIKSAADKLAFEREYGDLIAKGVNPELARQFVELDRIAAKSKENLELQIQMLEAKAAELPITSEIRKELEQQIELRKQQLKLIPGATDQAKGETQEERRQRNERERREQDAQNAAERAKQLYRGIVNTIEDGIVGSIQAGLDSLIDGTKKLDQALKDIAAGVLKEISNQLLRFAVNLGMRAIFPGVFADGGVFTSSGVQAFAGGDVFSNSIVSSPTLFKFADGGAMKTGLMGEAGPEAIMPLRRGPDGRLGVDASGLAVPFQRPTATADGAELAVPFQRTAAGLQVPFMKDAAAAESAAAGGPATIDVRFETVRIGDLDVVTREEAQRIGRESAERGAELAHKRYRNNPSARRAVGMA